MKTVLAGVCAGLLVVVAPSVARASSIMFHVDITTSALVGNPSGPFSLDFQLNDGGNGVTNTATIEHFTFGGGAAVGAATTTGSASGSLQASINLSDVGGFFNDIYQEFTPGTSLGFDVTLSGNFADPADAFSVAILDGSLFNLATTLSGDTFVLVNISHAGLGFGDVQLGESTDPRGVIATAHPVPEPSSMVLVGAGLALWLARRRK